MATLNARVMAALLLATVGPTLAPELSRAQIPAATISAPNGRPKDFALVKQNGVFHVFYIETGPQSDFNYLGHQSSADLYHWTVEPNVLVGDRSDWNPDFVWAPSIVERNGVFWMFYTGVRNRPAAGCPGAPYQQIGVATSTDLFQWSLAPDSWLDPTEVPWSLQPTDSCTYSTFGGFRDPNVVWDPETQQWIMLYVTVPSPDSTSANVQHAGVYDPNRYVVAEAHAPASFASDADWTNLEALWITDAAYPAGTGITTWESPNAFSRTWQGQPLWFLFASTGPTLGVNDVSFMTGPSLTLARFAKKGRIGWTWQGSIDNLQIVDSYGDSGIGFGAFATEYFRDPETGVEYFGDVRQNKIEIRRLVWRNASFGFDLQPPFRVREIVPQPFAAQAQDPIDLDFRAVSAQDGAGPKTLALEAEITDAAGDSIGLTPPATVGLPAAVTISSDDTHITWTAPTPLDPPLRVRIRLAAEPEILSDMITIWGRARKISDPGGPMQDFSRRPAAAALEPLSLRAREVAASSPTLSIRLPAAGAARLDLYDLRGRRVRRLLDRSLPAGAFDVTWDGRDDRGGRLAVGVYFARLETPRGARSARLLLR